jgi:hypothetical protein
MPLYIEPVVSLHQDILPDLVEDIKAYHDECAIVLIGSVARGEERPESDLDLNIFLPDDDGVSQPSPYIDGDNRWQLKIKRDVNGIRIDIAWETYERLAEHLQGDGAADCWPFSNGKILHDPRRMVEPCLANARKWFDEHPDTAARIEAEYVQSKEKQIRERGQS